jgi:hypothetical protein
MNKIFSIKSIEFGNVYNFTYEDIVLKPIVVELE